MLADILRALHKAGSVFFFPGKHLLEFIGGQPPVSVLKRQQTPGQNGCSAARSVQKPDAQNKAG